jgi:hypothetical protein
MPDAGGQRRATVQNGRAGSVVRPQTLDVVDPSRGAGRRGAIGMLTKLTRGSLVYPESKIADQPRVRHLEWSIDTATGTGSGFVTPEAGECLLGFVRPADASPERIEAFAQRWGILGIYEHGKPRAHRGSLLGVCVDPWVPRPGGCRTDGSRSRPGIGTPCNSVAHY